MYRKTRRKVRNRDGYIKVVLLFLLLWMVVDYFAMSVRF
jgi:hypothetical protein